MRGEHVPDVMFGGALTLGALSTLITLTSVDRYGLSWFHVVTITTAGVAVVASVVGLVTRYHQRRADRVWWTR